jgi:hypothetical protein
MFVKLLIKILLKVYQLNIAGIEWEHGPLSHFEKTHTKQ